MKRAWRVPWESVRRGREGETDGGRKKKEENSRETLERRVDDAKIKENKDRQPAEGEG